MRKAWIVVFAFFLWLAYGFSLYRFERQGGEFLEIYPSTTPCIALDVVFVIDQSYSMEWNDPLRNRFDVVKVAMEWLITDRWGRCPNIVHRVGVISFGDRAFIDLPLTPLQPTSENEWKKMRDELSGKFGPRALGGTNHLAGLQKAKFALEQAPVIQGPYKRKRIVLLLTDGSPCVARLGCKYKEGMSEEAERQYMEELKEWVEQNLYFSPSLLERERALNVLFANNPVPTPKEINNIIAQYPVDRGEEEKSIYLWVLALHNEQHDYLRTTGPYFETIAQNHGGSLIRLKYNRQDIPQEVDRVLSRMLGVMPQRLQCGKFIVPPYLEALSIHIYKNAGELKVRLQDGPYVIEAGQDVGDRKGALEHFAHYMAYRESGPQNEHYMFLLPRPGQWEISSGHCNGIQVSVVPVQAQIELFPEQTTLSFPLFHASGSNRYDTQHPHWISFRLQPSSEQVRASLGSQAIPPIENIPQCRLGYEGETRDCSLQMQAEIVDPSGRSETYPVTYEEETSTWKIAHPVPVDQVGEYRVRLYGYTECWWAKEPTAVQLASALCEEGKYNVVPKGSVEFSYQVTPTELFTMRALKPAQGERLQAHLPPTQGLKPAPLSIQVQLVSVEDGKPLPVQRVFPENPERAVKAVVHIGEETQEVWLQPSASDESILEGEIQNWDAVGRQAQLVVSMEGEPDYRYYQAQGRQIVVEFQRLDTLWTSPLTYQCLIALLVLFGAGVVMYNIWLRTNPITGYLEFETETGETIRIPIGGKRRVKRAGGQVEQLGLKKIIAERTGTRLRVRLIPKQGAPVQGTLQPKSPTSLGQYRVRWEGAPMPPPPSKRGRFPARISRMRVGLRSSRRKR